MNFEDYKNNLPYPSDSTPESFMHRVAYDAEDSRIVAKFKEDFFNELDIQNNPKKELLFLTCNDRGHSGGYRGIMNCGYDFVELIK